MCWCRARPCCSASSCVRAALLSFRKNSGRGTAVLTSRADFVVQAVSAITHLPVLRCGRPVVSDVVPVLCCRLSCVCACVCAQCW